MRTAEMKIVIAGGTGQLGTLFARARHAAGDEVIVLSRSPREAPWRIVAWDAATVGPWAAEVDGAAVVANFAGRSVNCRYTPKNKRAIIESRVDSTRAIGTAIAAAAAPPRVWLQMSTATLYAHRYDAPNDELTGEIGGAERDAPAAWHFSTDVVRAWERAVDEAGVPRTRKVKLRAAVVIALGAGGPFDILLRLVRLGLGGPSGDGRQYVSWIHERDFVRALAWIVERDALEGAVNVTAPNPLPNAEFMRGLRRAWGARIGLPSPSWMLAAGALMMRTETELVLKSRRVVPRKLVESGFAFEFPDWPEAAAELCARVRGGER